MQASLRRAVMSGRVHTAYGLNLGNRKKIDCVKSCRKKMKENYEIVNNRK